jgi:peptide-methionine (R)-S-oxide reductase
MARRMQIDRRTVLGLGAAAVAIGVATTMPGGRGADAQPARFPFRLSDAEWRRRLGPQRYAILRQAGTERAGSSPLDREHRRGTFHCAGCSRALFSSTAKFDSGTGWPSFFRPLPRAVAERADNGDFMRRTEVLCANCGGHLGHVFNDGPRPTGLRYCMNGLAMTFRAA